MVVSIAFYVGFLPDHLRETFSASQERVQHHRRAVVLGSALLVFPAGLLADRWDLLQDDVVMTVIGSLGVFLFSLTIAIAAVTLTAFIWQAFTMATTVASGAWLKDRCPKRTAASSPACA
jgi:MFS family permease